MKKIIFLLFAVILTVSMKEDTGISIFTFDSEGKILVNEEFVDVYDYSDYEDATYSTCLNSVTLELASKDIDVKFYDYDGWVYDPGYNVIEFCDGNEVIYKYISIDGIIPLNFEEGHYYGKRLSEYSDNGYFIEHDIDGGKLLVFAGYSYSPPQLLIFVLRNDEIQLIFDKKYFISSIEQSLTKFEMKVESVSKQLISMNPDTWSEPVTHTIWLEDGVLKFKDN